MADVGYHSDDEGSWAWYEDGVVWRATARQRNMKEENAERETTHESESERERDNKREHVIVHIYIGLDCLRSEDLELCSMMIDR